MQLLGRVLSKEAWERLGNLQAVDPAHARSVEDRVMGMARSGQILQQLTDAQLKRIMEGIKSARYHCQPFPPPVRMQTIAQPACSLNRPALMNLLTCACRRLHVHTHTFALHAHTGFTCGDGLDFHFIIIYNT